MKKIKVTFLGLMVTFCSCNAPDSTSRVDKLAGEKKVLQKEAASGVTQKSNYQQLGLDIHEQELQIDLNTDIGQIFNSSKVLTAISAESFAMDGSRQYSEMLDANTGKTMYTMNLKSPDPNITAGLVVSPIDVEHGLYEIFITKVVNHSGQYQYLIKSILSALPYIDMDPGVNIDPAAMTDDQKETVAKFKGCMAAAWNDCNSDFTSTMACTLCFPACVAACLLSCGYKTVTQSGYSTPECASVTTQNDAIKCLCSVGVINCTLYYLTSIPARTSTTAVNLAFVSAY